MKIYKVYFAHPISTYNTILEKIAIKEIKSLGECELINPNSEFHQQNYKKFGMNYFKHLVKSCDYVFVLPFTDGSIGAGINKEIKWALEENKICIKLKIIFEHEQIFKECYNSKNYTILSVNETREKLKSENNI